MTLWLEIGGRQRKVELPTPLVSGEMTCLVDGRPYRIDVASLTPGMLSLLLLESTQAGGPAGQQFRCTLDLSPEGLAVLVNGHRAAFAVEDPRSLRSRRAASTGADGPRQVKAPMPGRVIRVLVTVGDEVAQNQGLIVIEAMKMQNELKSPKAGRVTRIAAAVGDTVQSGQVLIVVA